MKAEIILLEDCAFYCAKLSRAFSKMGYKVKLVTTRKYSFYESYLPQECELVTLKPKLRFLEFLEILKSVKPHSIIVANGTFEWGASYFTHKLMRNAKWAIILHGSDIRYLLPSFDIYRNRFKRALALAILKKAKIIFYANLDTETNLRLIGKEGIYLPIPIDISLFTHNEGWSR